MTKAESLIAHLDAFVGFARKRLADPELAADVVQDALAKALAHLDDVEDEDRVVAWFYRILRNTLIDLHRRGEAVTAAETAEPAAADLATADVCACLLPLVDRLKPEFADAIRAVDLDGRPLDSVAAEQGITVGNLKVRRVRARQELRSLLEATCRLCAQHGCLDCSCRRASHAR